MALPFLQPSRCVLLVGDESLYVYNVTYNAARLIDSIPWQAEDFEDNVTELIRKDCRGKPVLILNDMTDQHFKGGQRVPNVGLLDKSNVLKRKLQVAFPNYPIRGALALKQGKASEAFDRSAAAAPQQKRLSGGLYLFAAVPMSEPIVKTVRAVQKSLAPISGFCLLPVEASDMVKVLADKLAPRGKKGARWVVFVGQHQNGDLRQVITRDGQLAMTRMTSVIDSDADPHAWAQEVGHEIKATISYLSRFGYTPDDGTDMIVIAGQRAGEAVQGLIDFECNYKTLTAPEAANTLGIDIGVQDEARYADPLHVAWAGRKSRFILPMQAAEVTKIHQPRQMAAAGILLLLAGAGYLGYQLVVQAGALMNTRGQINEERRVFAQAESEYQQEVERMATMGFDVKLIQASINAYESFERDRIGALPVMAKIGEALGNDLFLDKLTVKRVDDRVKVMKDGVETDSTVSRFDVRLNLSFPPTIDPEYGIREISGLERKLKALLPNFKVKTEKQVADPEYTAATSGVAGKEEETQETYVAEISIKGPFE